MPCHGNCDRNGIINVVNFEVYLDYLFAKISVIAHSIIIKMAK